MHSRGFLPFADSWRPATIPSTFIVEVLVVCDEAFVRSFKTEESLIVYLVIMFNSVSGFISSPRSNKTEQKSDKKYPQFS